MASGATVQLMSKMPAHGDGYAGTWIGATLARSGSAFADID